MQTNLSDQGEERGAGRSFLLRARMQLATRVAVFALVAVVLALMYQGERWMLERSSSAADPSQIATCAFDAVGEIQAASCARDLIQ